MPKKILFTSEITSAKSGFGKMGKEILSRLSHDDRFEIGQLCSFGSIESDYSGVNWKAYPVTVSDKHPEHQIFASNPNNNFGAWRADRILLDFKPDIVMNWGDPWNYTFLNNGPFRKFFHMCAMPTFDSIPQQTAWFDSFRDLDSMFLYADWPTDYLKKHGIDVVQALYPGVDTKLFKPKDKKESRKILGLPEDAVIIGTVMRNQQRKLFAELFKAFRIYLDKYGNTETGKKTYLYCHTSYPDVGWNIPDLLNEFGIANRVYFSYICTASHKHMAMKFSGGKTCSPYTGGPTAQLPNVGNGFSEEQLSDIYSSLDLYVQYANCEGLGIPSLEAASCGTVVAAINYSAMSDVVRLTGGIPLNPAAMPRCNQMLADRVSPDNDYAAEAFYKFLTLDDKYKTKKSKQAREAAIKYFEWDTCAETLANHFDNIKLTGLQGRWDAPIQINDQTIPTPPENLSNLQFVQWVCAAVAKKPELFYKYVGIQWLSWLNNGGFLEGGRFNPITRENIYEICKAMGTNLILGERARSGIDKLNYPDFIEFAHLIQGK